MLAKKNRYKQWMMLETYKLGYLKAMFGSLEGSGRKNFGGWKIWGKMKKSFKKI